MNNEINPFLIIIPPLETKIVAHSIHDNLPSDRVLQDLKTLTQQPITQKQEWFAYVVGSHFKTVTSAYDDGFGQPLHRAAEEPKPYTIWELGQGDSSKFTSWIPLTAVTHSEAQDELMGILLSQHEAPEGMIFVMKHPSYCHIRVYHSPMAMNIQSAVCHLNKGNKSIAVNLHTSDKYFSWGQKYLSDVIQQDMHVTANGIDVTTRCIAKCLKFIPLKDNMVLTYTPHDFALQRWTNIKWNALVRKYSQSAADQLPFIAIKSVRDGLAAAAVNVLHKNGVNARLISHAKKDDIITEVRGLIGIISRAGKVIMPDYYFNQPQIIESALKDVQFWAKTQKMRGLARFCKHQLEHLVKSEKEKAEKA